MIMPTSSCSSSSRPSSSSSRDATRGSGSRFGRWRLTLVLLAVAALLLGPQHAAAAGAQTAIQQSLDGGSSWLQAGTLDLQGAETTAVFEPLGKRALAQLRALVESDGLYLWRVQPPGGRPVVASVKAACLAPALHTHQLALQLDTSGRVVSAAISVPPAATPGGSCSTSLGLQALSGLGSSSSSSSGEPRRINVTVRSPSAAPAVPARPAGTEVPDLMAAAGAQQQAAAAAAAAAQQRQRQRQQQQQGEGGKEGEAPAPLVDERTWLQKNWLVVIAGGMAVLNMVLKGLAPEELRQPGGGAGGPAGRAAPAQRRARMS